MTDKEKLELNSIDIEIGVLNEKLQDIMDEWSILCENVDTLRNTVNEEEEQKENWIPNVGETYYFLDVIGDVDKDVWRNTTYEKLRQCRGNCFKTREEAEVYLNNFIDDMQVRMILKERKEKNDR